MLQWMNRRENASYMICFRALYGAVTGIVLCVFQLLCQRFDFGQTCFALIGAVIPVLMSGGIYLSGFMRTSETLADRLFDQMKRKPAGQTAASADDGPGRHAGYAGAHAFIAAVVFFLLYAGGLSLVRKDTQLALLGIGYVISRTLYGMAFVRFPAAEQETGQKKGSEKEKREPWNFSPVLRRTLRIILSVILALCFCTCIVIEPIMGMLEALLCMWIWTYYYYMSKRVFGGVTEESAGYFLILCELATALFVGMFGRAFL